MAKLSELEQEHNFPFVAKNQTDNKVISFQALLTNGDYVGVALEENEFSMAYGNDREDWELCSVNEDKFLWDIFDEVSGNWVLNTYYMTENAAKKLKKAYRKSHIYETNQR